MGWIVMDRVGQSFPIRFRFESLLRRSCCALLRVAASCPGCGGLVARLQACQARLGPCGDSREFVLVETC